MSSSIDIVVVTVSIESVTARLTKAGFIAAPEEAKELRESAHGDDVLLETLVNRRLSGEPLAWITGVATFCGLTVQVHPGVYVPRWQSEPLARRAASLLPPRGTAIDLCTGSGCIAMTLTAARPEARVVGTELEVRALECATANEVEVVAGDLFSGVPENLEGAVDVVVGVVPYVPTASMGYLPRDTFAFENTLAYDGGEDGTDLLRRAVRESPRFLRPGGTLLLELGGDEAEALRAEMVSLGYRDIVVVTDDDGDVRGIEATFGA